MSIIVSPLAPFWPGAVASVPDPSELSSVSIDEFWFSGPASDSG